MPRVFNLKSECAIYDVAAGEISCSNCAAYWTTDDSYHWYREGACGCGAGTQLENYDAVTDNAEYDDTGYIGKLVINDDGNAFCPVCGLGELKP